MTLSGMTNKHRKTLVAIFSKPTPTSIVWADLVSLLLAIGCDMDTDGGSHFAFRRGGEKIDFHRPHPGKELKRYQVSDAREFLRRIEVTP
jgi:hypothetical protein